MLREDSSEVTEPLEVLHGTTRVIVDYLRTVFGGQAGVRQPLPSFIKPAKLGEPN